MGEANVACCQPLALSLVNVTLPSRVPVADQRLPTCVPVVCVGL